MVSHIFPLKTPVELEEEEDEPKEEWGFFSLFLPSSYSLDRSKIRLDVLKEFAPPEPLVMPNK